MNRAGTMRVQADQSIIVLTFATPITLSPAFTGIDVDRAIDLQVRHTDSLLRNLKHVKKLSQRSSATLFSLAYPGQFVTVTTIHLKRGPKLIDEMFDAWLRDEAWDRWGWGVILNEERKYGNWDDPQVLKITDRVCTAFEQIMGEFLEGMPEVIVDPSSDEAKMTQGRYSSDHEYIRASFANFLEQVMPEEYELGQHNGVRQESLIQR